MPPPPSKMPRSGRKTGPAPRRKSRASKVADKDAPKAKTQRMSIDELLLPEIVSASKLPAPVEEEEPDQGLPFAHGLKADALTSNSGAKWLRKRLSLASTWWFVFILVIIAGVAVVTFLFSRGSHFGGLSLPAWCIFIGASMLFWPVAYLAAKIVSFFICRALTKAGQYKIAYYINGSIRAARYLIWSIFFFIFWTTIFSLNPLPAQESAPGGGKQDVEPDVETLWFMFRFLVVNIILAVYLGGRHAVVLSFRVQRQAEQFHDKVVKVQEHEEVFDVLTADIPLKFFKFNHRGRHYNTLLQMKKKRADNTTISREQAVLIIQRAWRRIKARKQFSKHRHEMVDAEKLKLLEAESAKKINEESEVKVVTDEEVHEYEEDFVDDVKATHPDLLIHQRLASADYVKTTPMEVCRGLKQIPDEKMARRLARLLWDKFSENGHNIDIHGSFRNAFKRKPDLFPKAHALFDPYDIRILEFDTFESHVLEAFQHRTRTSAELVNADSILGALSSFLSGVVGLLMFITMLIAFSSGPFQSIALTIGTTFLALSFIFADSCRNVFNSFVFLFIRDPYEVGDRVHVNAGPPLYVLKLELMTTTFRDFAGKVQTIPNYVLQKDKIINIRRSGPLLLLTDLQVHYLTPAAKLDTMEKEYRTYLATHPADFIEAQSKFLYRGLENTNRLHIQLRTRHSSNWQNGEHHRRRSLVIREIMAICSRLGIKYYPPRMAIDTNVDFRAETDTLQNFATAMRGGTLHLRT